MEYYDRTLFEISIELEGYNRRWEDIVRTQVRPLYALTYNINAEKGKQKPAIELMPTPSDASDLAWLKKERQMEDEIKWKRDVIGKGDGSGISS